MGKKQKCLKKKKMYPMHNEVKDVDSKCMLKAIMEIKKKRRS